eukprot:TRINITY_DN2155_c0_g1_i6.p1 TRINITY_DN2155_c0_g1~~TRINITY_DN2155_c0_g1_i6.p1  ORF type:complete len:511 (-),score=103.20 TRINITY_DN2155_c0_g1_i6:229-1761(-)
MIRLCDKTGWTYSRIKSETGSIFDIAWTLDSTQFCGSGGNGSVVFGHMTGWRIETGSLSITIEDYNRISVRVVQTDMTETLDFKDRVIKASVAYGQLVVATATQIVISNTDNLSTPQIFDIKDVVSMVKQTEKYFLTVDNINGLQVYSYDGRFVCSPKSPNLRIDNLNSQLITLSNDTIAVIDRNDPKNILLFDTVSGRQLGVSIKHTVEVSEIYLEQHGPASERKLAIIDRNRELYLTSITKPNLVKVATMVSSVLWHDTTSVLAVLMDQKLTLFYYPHIIYVDRDLINATKLVRDAGEFGLNPQLVSFTGTQLMVRRNDGALLGATMSPYPVLLYEKVEKPDWNQAVILCRYVKDPVLWATLAAMSINGNHLETAEVALASIDEVDKLQYILWIASYENKVIRAALLHMYRRNFDEAEALLIQNQYYYRAIKMRIRSFEWDKAFDIAVKQKKHIDTVFYYRKKYLASTGKQETNKRFMKLSEEVKIDEEAIRLKISEDKARERGESQA